MIHSTYSYFAYPNLTLNKSTDVKVFETGLAANATLPNQNKNIYSL